MREIKSSVRFDKGFKRCKKRGYDMSKLYNVLQILSSRDFTSDEIYKYKVHKLNSNRRYSNCMELHIGGRNSDWLLIYHVSGNVIHFDDTIVTLEDTGTHADCFESEQVQSTLVWL